MSSTTRLFEDPAHTRQYAQSRPRPPRSLVERVIGFLREQQQQPRTGDGRAATTRMPSAVDVGCGSGQATSLLCPHFDRVVGLDFSPAQIDEAKKMHEGVAANLEFEVSSAETLPMEASSVDLVLVCAAVHWFDLPVFFREVDRVLRPGGVLAMISYNTGWTRVTGRPDATQHILDWYDDVKSYASDVHRKYVATGYAGLPSPYADATTLRIGADDGFCEDSTVSLATLEDFFRSISYFRRLCERAGRAEGESKMDKLSQGIRRSLGVGAEVPSVDVSVQISHPFFGVLAAKPPL